MRRLLLALAFLMSAASASAQNCTTLNGVTRCVMPWQVYDGTVRAVSKPVLDLRQTWNNPSVTFTGLALNVTDTNSATASLLLDLQKAGVSQFKVDKSGNITALGTFTPTGVLLLPDGTVAAPSLARVSVPSDGISFATNLVRVSNNGVDRWAFDSSGSNYQFTLAGSQLAFSSANSVYGNSADLFLSRAAAATVKVAGSAAVTAEVQVSGGNGGFISSVKALTELTTIAAAATTNTAIQIPANAVVLGVSVRVVTVIPTAATFTVTSATPAKTWNTAAVTVASGSTDPGTAPGPSFQTTASAITITPNLTPGTATGQVRVTIFYYTITPPTS